MPTPLDWIRQKLAGEMPPTPPVPPAPDLSWTRQAKRPTDGPVPRVPVQDTRTVAPNARVGGRYAQEPLENVIREAGAAGVPLDLALAMAIREQSTDLTNPSLAGGDTFKNPLTLNYKPAWAADAPNQIEPAMLHAVERASVVAPEGRERQIQAYQGLGKQPAGYNERFLGQPNPYAKAVEEIRERVVNASPQLQALMQTVKPVLDPLRYSEDHLTAIAQNLSRRTRNPGLFRQ